MVIAVATATKLLARYGDLGVLFGMLPLLSHVKFGALMHQAEARAKQKRAEAAAAEVGAEVPPSEKDEGAEGVPPCAAMFLLLLAEICSSAQLFNPTDKLVRRAVGDMARAHKNLKPGFMSTLELVMQMLEKDDVYELVRFLSNVAALGGLAITVGLKLHETGQLSSKAVGHPLREMFRAAKNFFRVARAPQVWFLYVLTLCFAIGNWSLLGKFFARPGTMDFVQALGQVLRTLGLASVVATTVHGGPLPTWAGMQIVAACARAARVYVYERVSPTALIHDGILHATGDGSASVAAVQGALGLEALCVVLLLPCLVRRARMIPLTALLLVPIAALVVGGPAAKILEVYMPPQTLHKAAIGVAILAVLLVFTGGILTMVSFLFVLQALAYIHKLDKMRI